MSDSLKAIYEDTERYLHLCQHFGEKPVRDETGANPYCQHAHDLKERLREEENKKRFEIVERSPEYRLIREMLENLLGRIEDRKLYTELIDPDPRLKKWWEDNRESYDAYKAKIAAQNERNKLIQSARSKLSPEELTALGL